MMDVDTVEVELRKLAIAAKQHPPKSLKRRLALSRMFEILLQQSQLRYFKLTFRMEPGLYQYVYEEALSETILEFCQRIDNYQETDEKGNPKSVIAWFAFILDMRARDVYGKYKKGGITYWPKSNGCPNLNDLEMLSLPDKILSESQQLRQAIDLDIGGIFAEKHVRDRPDVNFRTLALAHIWDDRTWTDISSEIGVPVQTLSRFFQQTLKEFAPFFRKYLEN